MPNKLACLHIRHPELVNHKVSQFDRQYPHPHQEQRLDHSPKPPPQLSKTIRQATPPPENPTNKTGLRKTPDRNPKLTDNHPCPTRQARTASPALPTSSVAARPACCNSQMGPSSLRMDHWRQAQTRPEEFRRLHARQPPTCGQAAFSTLNPQLSTLQVTPDSSSGIIVNNSMLQTSPRRSSAAWRGRSRWAAGIPLLLRAEIMLRQKYRSSISKWRFPASCMCEWGACENFHKVAAVFVECCVPPNFQPHADLKLKAPKPIRYNPETYRHRYRSKLS